MSRPPGAPTQEQVSRLIDIAIAGLRRALDTRPSRRLVLVCDPALADPLKPLLVELDLRSHAVPVSRALPFPATPYLVEIEDEIRHQRFVDASVRLAVEQAVLAAPPDRRPRSVCAWLLTQEPLEVIVNDFARLLRIRDPAGALRAFRFWDPRATQHIATFAPGQPPASWLPYADWGYIDAFGCWSLLAGTDAPPKQPSWTHLQLLSQVNAVQQRLATDGLCHAADVLPQIRQSLQVARQAGLHDADLVCFAEQRVRRQAAIEHAPLVQEAIAEALQTGGHFHKIAETFEEAHWHAGMPGNTALKTWAQDMEPSHEA